MIKGLDRWLTTPPYDGFDNWCEQVVEAFTDSFFESNEEWIMECNGLCTDWLNKLQNKEPEKAAKVIERAFGVYC